MNKYPWWRRNVYVDISATAAQLAGGPFAEQLVWVLRKVGIDRVLFGSDYPFFDPGEALDAVRSHASTSTSTSTSTSHPPAVNDGS